MKKFIMFLLIVVGFCWCFSKGVSIGKIIGESNVTHQSVIQEQPIVDKEMITLLQHIAVPEKDITGTIFECNSFRELEEKAMKYVYEMAESEGTALWMK